MTRVCVCSISEGGQKGHTWPEVRDKHLAALGRDRGIAEKDRTLHPQEISNGLSEVSYNALSSSSPTEIGPAADMPPPLFYTGNASRGWATGSGLYCCGHGCCAALARPSLKEMAEIVIVHTSDGQIR